VTGSVRVLVADRSPSVRAVLRRLLEEGQKIAIVADVGDGREASRLAAEKKPAAVILDLELPSLGGQSLVERITNFAGVPILVLVPRGDPASARMAMRLCSHGVATVFPKPQTADEWRALGKTLRDTVLQIGSRRGEKGQSPIKVHEPPVVRRELRYVAIGASTGGPGAIHEMLAAIGPHSRLGVAVVQHIAEGFERTFSEWLAAELRRDVAVARHGELLENGMVRIAPPGHHLSVDRDGRLRLDQRAPPVGGHRPSVDVLFRSLLEQPANRVAAVLLSGMGSDGAEAMSELRDANVLTVVQDEASCAVFGMPRAAIERRAAVFALAPPQIGQLLSRAEGARR
jgi:two-component system chemotaxis response regulator CheB